MLTSSFIHEWNLGFKELFKQCVKWLLIEMQVSNSGEWFYYNHVVYLFIWLF